MSVFRPQSLIFLGIFLLLLLGFVSAAATTLPVAPPQPEAVSDLQQGIESIAGSSVIFDPAAGGDACYIPGETQTFCFKSQSYTTDYEYVLDVFMRFPSDWTISDVYVAGEPTCDSGANFGFFQWSYYGSDYEVDINHPRNQQPVDSCTAYYCVDVVAGSGPAQESWYYKGEEYGDPPHFPCSADQYTPGGQPACDEWINPVTEIPACQWFSAEPDPVDFIRWDCTWFDDGSGPSAYNQKVYCLGGRTDITTELPDIWRFDPLTGAWEDTGDDMFEDVSNYTANLLVDENFASNGLGIYVVGGSDADNNNVRRDYVQRYYPKTGGNATLVESDPWPGEANTFIPGACVDAQDHTRLYCFGGFQNTAPPFHRTATYVYDPLLPAGTRWQPIPTAELSLARGFIQAAVLDDIIYAMGGDIWDGADLAPVALVEALDLNDLGSGWQLRQEMPVPLAEGQAFSYDGSTEYNQAWMEKIYTAGGGDWPGESAEVMAYNPLADAWTQSYPDLNVARRNQAGVFVPYCTVDPEDGLPGLWVFGGRAGSDSPPYGEPEFYPFACATPDASIIAPPLEIDLPVETLARTPITVCNEGNAPLSFKFDEEPPLNILASDPPPPGSVTIDFDDLTGGCAFTETVALRDEYAAQGVYFSGGAPLDGGAVLGECSGPAPAGISSPNFLAFDYSATLEDGGIPVPPQVITFTQPVDYVRINAGSLTNMDAISLEAWDVNGRYIWGVSIISEPEMQPLTLIANNIARLVIQAWTPTPSFVLDDLVYLPASVGATWLEEYPPAGILPLGECTQVDVQYSTASLATGAYSTTLTVVTNDPNQPETPLPVTLGVHAPAAQVTPEALEARLAPGDSSSVPLEVCNPGDWPLDFALVEEAGMGMAPQGPLSGTVGLFKDADPYGTTEVEQFLTAQGIPFEIHGFNDLGLMHFNHFSLIIFSGDQPQKFYDAYEFYADRFEDYVEDGGFLLFVAHDAGNNSGYLWADLPRGVTYQNGIWEALDVIDVPSHPVFAGVPNPFSGDFASSGKFGNLPPDATVLAHGMDWGEPTAIEYPIGRGWFWSFTGALEAAHAWGWEGGPMMENSILWGYSYAPEELPWLSQTPGLGTVAAGECLTVPIGFEAENLEVGVYTATLELDSSDPDTQEIDIPVSLTVAIPLQVEFSSNSPVTLGEMAVFTSTVSGVGPFEFLWDFGDGLTSTLENPTHLYSSAGSFNVTLTVSSPDETASATHSFQVVAPAEYTAYLPLLLKADSNP